MKKYIYFMVVATVMLSATACKKSSTTDTANPLAAVNANWKNINWGGVANNDIVIKIDQTAATGVIQSIGTQTFNYTVGETIFSNITATANASVFNCAAIFKYGAGNMSTANTTATITLQGSGTQILIHYTAAAGIQPPDYVYTKQ
jgi:hypothetical protein